MKPRILLVNPPIYDFTAYDFWLRPYGLLSVAGQLRGQADMCLFDYLDRLHPSLADAQQRYGAASGDPRPDRWGRGRFPEERIPSPAPLAAVPRYFRRFGLPRGLFRDYLGERGPFDFALIQTVMTYWYPGVGEVIEDIRDACPAVRIVLGGNYATLCTSHARRLKADLVVVGAELRPLWELLQMKPDPMQPALWEAYDRLQVGAIKLSDGCPFHCSYCSVPQVYAGFRARPQERSLAELELMVARGARDIAFYDDALLFDAERVLAPFLEEVVHRGVPVNLHTPNALNARFITAELAELMVRAGFKTFYLGFESTSRTWQQGTGGKVFSEELARAVGHLRTAGADPRKVSSVKCQASSDPALQTSHFKSHTPVEPPAGVTMNQPVAGAGADITAYQIIGHPDSDLQELEESMRFVHRLGIRGMLADFSPIPGTPDGEACRRWVDLDEPLMHNKTAFPIIRLGFDEVNRLKDLQRALNRSLTA